MQNWIIPITVVAIAVVTAIGRLTYWMGEVNADRKGVNETMKGVTETMTGVNETMTGVTETLKEIRDDIKKLLGRLPAPTVGNNSPIQLSDLGRSVSNEMSARDWAERMAPSLVDRIKGKHPFEIQDMCFDYVKDEFEPGPRQKLRLRTIAYEKAIDLDAVLDVFAVELRDQLLQFAEPPDLDADEGASSAHA